MLTGSMIEKFTKRIEDLNKVKQQYTDVPHYNLADEEHSDNSDGNDSRSDSINAGKRGNQGNEQQSNSLKNSMRDCENQNVCESQGEEVQGDSGENVNESEKQSESGSERGNDKSDRNKREKQVEPQIPFQDQRNYLLQKIRGKLAKYSPNEANHTQNTSKVQKNQLNKEQKNRIKRRGRPSKQIAEKSLSKIQKKQKVTSQYSQNSDQNSQKSSKKSKISSQQQDKQQQNKQRSLAAQILNATKYMTSDQKQQYIKIRRKQENVPSKIQLKIWIDSYEMIFNVQNQIKLMVEKPEQRTISRMFAQLLHKHVKKNPTDKKYKLRRICAFALKELDLKSQKVDTWLKRFMLQNCTNIKGVDLSQYQSQSQIRAKGKDKSYQENKKQGKINDKNQINQSKDKNIRNAKNNDKSQSKGKQTEKQPRPIPRTKKFARRGRSKIINLTQSESEKSNSQQQEHSSDSKSSQPRRKSRKIQQKKQQKKLQQQKYFLKNQQIILQKQSPQQIGVQQNQKQVDEQIFNYIDDIFNAKEQQNNLQSYNGNGVQVKQQIQNSKMYPQNFRKKIAAKLDSTLHQVFETLMRQKCEEYCVEQQELKQIYQQFGCFIIKKQQNQLIHTKEQNNQQVQTQYHEEQQKRFYQNKRHEKHQQVPFIQKPRIIQEKNKDQNLKKQVKNQIAPDEKYQRQQKMKQHAVKQQKQSTLSSKQLKNKQRIDVQNYVADKKKEAQTPVAQPQIKPSSIITINHGQNQKKVQSQIHATNFRNIQNQQKYQKQQKPKDIHKLPEQSKIDETKQKSANPFQILGTKLMSFLKTNIGCSESLIKSQAVKIATTVPEIKGRIKQQALARWTHSFILKYKDKISVKSNSEQANPTSVQNSNINLNSNMNSNTNASSNSNSNSIQKPPIQQVELNPQPKIQIKTFSQPQIQPQPQPQPSATQKPNLTRHNQQAPSQFPTNFSNLAQSSSSGQLQTQSSSQLSKPLINPMMSNYSNPNSNQNNSYRGFQAPMPKINIPRVDSKNFSTINGNNGGNPSINSSTTTQASIKRTN